MTAEHPGYADEAEIRATFGRYVDELKAAGRTRPWARSRAPLHRAAGAHHVPFHRKDLGSRTGPGTFLGTIRSPT